MYEKHNNGNEENTNDNILLIDEEGDYNVVPSSELSSLENQENEGENLTIEEETMDEEKGEEPIAIPEEEVSTNEESENESVEETDEMPEEEVENLIPEVVPKTIYQFTHNDADAVGCGLVVSSFKDTSQDSQTIFCSISEVDNIIVNFLREPERKIPDEIIISDISISDTTASFLMNYCKDANVELHLYDHHISNHMPEKYDWAMVTQTTDDGSRVIAACEIMYLRYFERIDERFRYILSIIINSISRYDTWEWKNNPYQYDEEYTNILIKELGIVDTFKYLLRSLVFSVENGKDTFVFNEESMFLINSYKKKREKYLDNIGNRGIIATTFQEYTIAIVLLNDSFYNETMEYIYNSDDSIDIVFGIDVFGKSLSLRTKKEDVNLARFAKYYFNGGGHKKAAGAKLSKKKIMKLLNLYYTGVEYIEKNRRNQKEEK